MNNNTNTEEPVRNLTGEDADILMELANVVNAIHRTASALEQDCHKVQDSLREGLAPWWPGPQALTDMLRLETRFECVKSQAIRSNATGAQIDVCIRTPELVYGMVRTALIED
jgi:hypothetical protein